MSRSPDPPPQRADEPGLPAELARAVDGVHGAADLDRMYASLHAELGRERGLRAWLRARSTVARGLMALGLVAAVSALVALGFARPDLGSFPPARMALSLAAMALLMIVGVALALRPLQRAALPAWVGPAAITGSLAVLAGLYLVSPFDLPRAAFDAATLRPALVCMAIGLLLGVPVYGALLLLDRGGSRQALPMAMAAGLAANLELHIHCPSADPLHLMLGHFGAAVLLLLATALWVRAGR
ncbi:MAG TPA: hypothetical protein VK509_18670 [Polyangiales bacterium]|nr:hypothetical protein [Polyangiales bacterium]